MKKLLFIFLLASFSGFAQTQIPGSKIIDGTVTEPKLAPNALRPIEGGVLTDPELVFDKDEKFYTVSVTSDISLTLDAVGNVAHSKIIIKASGDGSHTLSFPATWIMKGDKTYDPTRIQTIELTYDGEDVTWEIIWNKVVIIPNLLTAALVGGTDDVTLTFDNAVSISTLGWTVSSPSGGAVTVSSVVSGTGTTTVVLDLSRNITAGDATTISYDPTTGGTISSTGNEIALISNFFVDTGSAPPVAFCDITVCASGCDYTTGQAASNAAIAGQTICFGAGTYRETIVGKTGVTYRNIPGEIAIISWLELAGTSGWTVHSGNIYKKTITLPVSGNFSTGDLTSTSTIMANQVFKDGDMMPLARWPKVSTPEDLLDRTKMRHKSSTSSFTATQITDSGLPSTGNLAGAHISILGWFFTQTRQITSRSSNTITFPATAADLHFSKWYYITNHIDLLTQAKEWFYSSGILYFWQTGGGSPTGVEYKARNWGFDLRGKDNVIIQGLHFIGCEPATGDTGTDGCTIDNIRATYDNHAFTQAGSDHIYRSALMNGIKLLGSNNTIKNSEFQYAASQLIWAGPNALIQNNLASNISYEGNYGAFCSPWLSAGGQRIIYNTVSRLGRSAIDFGYDGPDEGGGGYGGTHAHLNMEVGYNIFSQFLMLNIDGGATYGARGINLTGTVVHHNWIYDNAVENNWAGVYEDWYGIHTGIYYDQGAGPTINHHNVLWDGSLSDLFIQHLYGRITMFYNNTLAGQLPNTRESYTTYQNTPNDIIKNNLFTKVVNLNWGGTLGNLTNNLVTTDNSNQSSNNTVSNTPLFAGGTLGHAYELQSGSPARNIGVHIPGITDGYEGAAPDAGAYEFGDHWEPGYVATAGEDEPYIVDNSDMSYTVGSWTHAPGVPPTNTMSYSSTTGAKLTGSFMGTEVKFYSEKYVTHGIVEIKIDGVRVDCDPGTGGTQDCDLYQNTTVNNTQLIGTWSVSAGAHTYEQTLVGVNGSATGTGLNFFDYLYITP